ncbi:MAG: eS25 family ribosomal protein, partial [Candidatus Thorarchaeota archaeon]
MSRKKWGKSATKTDKVIRDAIPKTETLSEINQYLAKARSVTPFDLANRFGIRMSVARKILREKESDGSVVPYIRESGFVVYTTPAEIAKREGGAPIMTADVLEEISASVTHESVVDDDMEAALAAAASSAGTVVKPSKLAYRRREVGERKERKESRPEIVVEPLTKEEEEPVKKVEERPRKIEEKPKKVEEKPKKVEEKPKKVEEKPKKVEEKP